MAKPEHNHLCPDCNTEYKCSYLEECQSDYSSPCDECLVFGFLSQDTATNTPVEEGEPHD